MTWGAFWYPHVVSIRDLTGSGGMGDTYGAPRTVAAEVLDEQVLVRDADGREVVSSTRVTLALPERVPLSSKVTVWPGEPDEREADVLDVAVNLNDPPLDAFLVLRLK